MFAYYVINAYELIRAKRMNKNIKEELLRSFYNQKKFNYLRKKKRKSVELMYKNSNSYNLLYVFYLSVFVNFLRFF